MGSLKFWLKISISNGAAANSGDACKNHFASILCVYAVRICYSAAESFKAMADIMNLMEKSSIAGCSSTLTVAS